MFIILHYYVIVIICIVYIKQVDRVNLLGIKARVLVSIDGQNKIRRVGKVGTLLGGVKRPPLGDTRWRRYPHPGEGINRENRLC